MICYHHTDLDGISAAWIVHKHKPMAIEDFPSSYVATTYNSSFNKHEIRDDVFIVDLSFTENTYNLLLNVCKTARSVTWIDHHASSEELVKKHFKELQSIENLTYFVSTEGCGALLTYAYLNFPQDKLMEIRQTSGNETYNISAKRRSDYTITVTATKLNSASNAWHEEVITIPKWLFHVDDHDCWRKLDENTEFFQLGSMAENISITLYDKVNQCRYFNPFWTKMIIDTEIDTLITSGKSISKYIHSVYTRELKDTFEWSYGGQTFLCKNATGNSFNFEYKIKEYPAVILFRYSGKSGKWEYSIYADESSNFNCKKFAEQFGGGGHLKAAGFSTKMCIFTHLNSTKSTKENGKNKIYLFNIDDFMRHKISDTWTELENNRHPSYGRLSSKIKNFELFFFSETPDDIEMDAMSVFFIDLSTLNKDIYINLISTIMRIAYNQKVAIVLHGKNMSNDIAYGEFLVLGEHLKEFKGRLFDYTNKISNNTAYLNIIEDLIELF